MGKRILIFRRFAHRRNADASLDSICLGCFVTVGSAPLGLELQDFENNHRCALWTPGRLPPSTHEGPRQRRSLANRRDGDLSARPVPAIAIKPSCQQLREALVGAFVLFPVSATTEDFQS
jgi:hypothetical protein